MTKDLEESGPLGPYDEIEAMPPHTSSSSCVDDATRKSTASGLVKEHLPPLHLDAEKSEKKHYRAGTLHASEDVEHKFVMPFIPWNIIILLIFSALAESFGSSAISLFINLTLEYEPVQVTRYWMYVGLTIWMQPIIGYVADVFVIFGEKRRPLYIISAVGNTVIYCVYCFFPGSTATYGKLLGISMVSQFLMMGIYIPLNGLLVEIGRTDGETEDESTARIATIMSKAMVWRSSGSLAGTVLQTCLVLFMSVRELLGVTAICHFILIPLVLIAPRSLFLRPSLHTTNFYVSIQRTFNLLKTSFDITNLRSDGFLFILVLTFVFIYTLMPDASSVYYNYLYGEFMFEAWFYSMNNCLGMFGSIVGAYLFSLWMDYRALQEARGGVRTSIFFIFLIGSIAWALGYVTNLMLCTGFITDTLHISAEVFIPIDNFFMSMFVRFAFMPTIAMAAEHAPKYFEATAFEVFSVVSTGGGTASSMITAFIAEDLHITRSDYSNLWILIVISIGCKLVPIPLAYILPTRKSEEEDAMAMQRRMEEELPYSDPVIGGDAYMDPYVVPTCNPAGTGPQQVVVE